MTTKKEIISSLKEIIRDMKKIPNARLPLGKSTWLQEWYELEAKLEQIIGEN